MSKPDVATYNAVFANYRIAPKNSCSSINSNSTFNGRMSFDSPNYFTSLIFGERKSSQGNSLVYFYVVPNFTGLPDDYTGSMIDKETSSNSSSRMNIYTS